MCTSGKECRYKDTNEMKSLIESVETEEMDESSRVSITNYLLDVLRPGASSVGPVQQVLDRLAHQQSTADSGAAGLVTTSSSFPFILQFIRMQFISDPVSAADKLAGFALHLEAWATEDTWEQFERQLLLKEIRIGCRAKDLPTWTGHIIMPDLNVVVPTSATQYTSDMGTQRDLSLVPVRLRVHGVNVQGTNPHIDRVAYVQAADVDLSEHKDLLEVPEDVRRFKKYLLVIRVSSSFLVALPEWLGDLVMLEELDLHGCELLKVLPERLWDLMRLKKINLAGCKGLLTLSERLGNLTGLEELDLGGCYMLKALPERLGDLIGLKELNLRNLRRLKVLPERMWDLTGLMRFGMEGCSGFGQLPERLGDLTGVKELNLRMCRRLKVLPDRMWDLTGLQMLNLEMCSGFTGLSERLGDLVGLQALNLEGCVGLTGLPDRMGDMTGLQELYLGWCGGLKGLPERLGNLTGLKMLDLTGCKRITGLPHVMGSLTRLKTIKLT